MDHGSSDLLFSTGYALLFTKRTLSLLNKINQYQQQYDSVSRLVYCGNDSISVLEFQQVLNQAKNARGTWPAHKIKVTTHHIANELVHSAQEANHSIEQQKIKLIEIASAIEAMNSSVAEMPNMRYRPQIM